MNPTYKIHRATLRDAVGIAAVLETTWLATYPNAQADITAFDIKAMKFTPPTVVDRWWVATHDDEIVGACKVYPEQIRALYVIPKYQSKGIGTLLLTAALTDTGEDPFVDVAAYNHRAIAFYERHGFVQIEEYDDEPKKLPNGKAIPQVRLVRS